MPRFEWIPQTFSSSFFPAWNKSLLLSFWSFSFKSIPFLFPSFSFTVVELVNLCVGLRCSASIEFYKVQKLNQKERKKIWEKKKKKIWEKEDLKEVNSKREREREGERREKEGQQATSGETVLRLKMSESIIQGKTVGCVVALFHFLLHFLPFSFFSSLLALISFLLLDVSFRFLPNCLCGKCVWINGGNENANETRNKSKCMTWWRKGMHFQEERREREKRRKREREREKWEWKEGKKWKVFHWKQIKKAVWRKLKNVWPQNVISVDCVNQVSRKRGSHECREREREKEQRLQEEGGDATQTFPWKSFLRRKKKNGREKEREGRKRGEMK